VIEPGSKLAPAEDDPVQSNDSISVVLSLAVLALILVSVPAYSRQSEFGRLPVEVFDVRPPSARVSGEPGEMRIEPMGCATLGLETARRRIVDVAVQEWGFFGFRVVDETVDEPRGRRRRFRPRPEESVRVASSIGGYWAVTPEGDWILENQNDAWNGRRGGGSRWRDPWSAAFVSWVMCEGGLGDSGLFERAVAHRVYIDQAIRARDDVGSRSAFVAYDAGETEIVPGDLLCTARSPRYRTIDDRRENPDPVARTHCDVVTKVDAVAREILAIGGNVGGTVSLKRLPAIVGAGAILRPDWPTFAHLKLQADPIAADALNSSPTIRAVGCTPDYETQAQLAVLEVIPRFC
jgi:hypothetical protein